MPSCPQDPLEPDGIAGFGASLRAGKTSARAATAAYLERIGALDGRLGAYEHVDAERALAAADAIDRLLAAGTDLGPLMGVPVAIKDIIAVDGMPTTAGSNVDVSDLVGPEGAFVGMLKRAGCVILGKVKTTEFALGTLLGVNQVRGTPWNPWDAKTHRLPGSSSSGSGVATAAGLCGFAIGSDTGGSVRIPAAFNGVVGLKTTKEVWPTDGVFRLCPTFDTLSLLTRSAEDAAIVFATLGGTPPIGAAQSRGLRLGRPTQYFFDVLDPEVEQCLTAALGRLEKAGVEIAPVDLPEVDEANKTYAVVTPSELIAGLGRERFLRERSRMDPIGAERAALGLDTMADQYIRLIWRHRELVTIMNRRMAGFDGWLVPTSPMLPLPVAEAFTPEGARRLNEVAGRTTRHANLWGLCTVSTPVHGLGAPLPAGLQTMCRGFDEARALSIALLLERLIGRPPRPDLAAFTQPLTCPL